MTPAINYFNPALKYLTPAQKYLTSAIKVLTPALPKKKKDLKKWTYGSDLLRLVSTGARSLHCLILMSRDPELGLYINPNSISPRILTVPYLTQYHTIRVSHQTKT